MEGMSYWRPFRFVLVPIFAALSFNAHASDRICKNLKHCVKILKTHNSDSFDYGLLAKNFARFGDKGENALTRLLRSNDVDDQAAALELMARSNWVLSDQQKAVLMDLWSQQAGPIAAIYQMYPTLDIRAFAVSQLSSDNADYARLILENPAFATLEAPLSIQEQDLIVASLIDNPTPGIIRIIPHLSQDRQTQIRTHLDKNKLSREDKKQPRPEATIDRLPSTTSEIQCASETDDSLFWLRMHARQMPYFENPLIVKTQGLPPERLMRSDLNTADRIGLTWLAGYDRGLFLFSKDGTPQSLLDGEITAILPASETDFWVVQREDQGSMLYSYSDKGLQFISGLPVTVHAIHRDKGKRSYALFGKNAAGENGYVIMLGSNQMQFSNCQLEESLAP